MPSGVHNNHKGGGRKPECVCGRCYNCKQRVHNRAYRQRQRQAESAARAATVSDEELDRRMGLYLQSQSQSQSQG